MHNLEDISPRTLRDYMAIARRRRWWLTLPLFGAWALVVSGSHLIPPKYRSETVIIVEQQRIPEQYVVPNVVIDLQQRLQSMSQQILSRTRLLGIIANHHLYETARRKADLDVLVLQMRNDIKIDLVQSPGRPWELSAFKISYSAPAPELAQQVTRELSSFFIEENLRNRQQQSEDTTKFLESQLEQARQNLADQEARLSDFKSRYLGELPEQLQTNIQILSGLQSRLQAAAEALDRANQQKLYLESLLNQYRSINAQLASAQSNSGADPVTADEQLERLRSELAALSARDTPQHPDIVRLKQEILEAERMKQRSASEAKSATANESEEATTSARSLSDLQALGPMLQIEGQVKSNKLEIVNRQEEIRALERQIELYQAHLNMTPVREQQLAAITRDHDQSRTNYESLLNKKMQSQMATSLEKRQEGEQFRVIDPPNFPQKPYSPDRFKFNLFGIAIGLCLSLLIAALIETLDETIHSGEDLLCVTPAPILAAIPLLQTAAEQKRQSVYRRLEVAAAMALMAVIPLVTLLSYYRGRQ